MIGKVFCQGISAGIVGLGLLSPVAGAELRGLHLASAADSASLTLDLSERVAPKVFTLEHPDRLVIDLRHTRRAKGVRAPAAAGEVTGVRLGTQPGGTLRVVLELKSAQTPRIAWRAGGEHHLTLSLGTPMPAAIEQQAPVAPSAHALQEGDRDVIIAIDAGHGGQDPGAIGRGGTREKDVTLAIARALVARVNEQAGMRALLTRDRDEFLELTERVRRARVARADMFISVHADSIADRSISGASVYVLSLHGASSEAARWLADHENAADLMGGVRLNDKGALSPILLEEAQSQIIGVSATAAERVVSALQSVGEVRKAQVQQAGFVVLKSPDIPSMLVETAYISNPTEERRLRSSAQQARLADAIASGVRSFFTQNPPDGTRFKQQRRSTLASAAEGSATVATP